ncbi:MAG: hypothetical protein CSA07_03570 [Bacteroidia bacterium]|nr:MAG: hypothetical protein CSA07_03570 [Bacteroidia bacterium]
MDVSTIYELRRERRLKEAFQLAQQAISEEPGDERVAAAYFWVVYDYCKHFIESNDREKLDRALAMLERVPAEILRSNEYVANAYRSLQRASHPELSVIQAAQGRSKDDPCGAYESVKEFIESPDSVGQDWHEKLGWILYRYMKWLLEQEPLDEYMLRSLLRDYIQLRNSRPSLLHSRILWQATQLAKKKVSFDFPTFFLHWGGDNFRDEDLHPHVDGEHKYPSLLSHVCRQVATGGKPYDVGRICLEISKNRSLGGKGEVLDHLREPLFWHCYQLGKEGKFAELERELREYCAAHAAHGPSRWHSEILSLALRLVKVDDSFVAIFRLWDFHNLRREDFEPSKGKDGVEYPSLVDRLRKRFFEYVKRLQNRSLDIISWASEVYAFFESHTQLDAWAIREYAMLLTWQNRYSEAIDRYRDCLLEYPDRYFIWHELAGCVQDDGQLRMALLCKAVLCERDESFIRRLRMELAEQLYEQGLWAEAMAELDTYERANEKRDAAFAALRAKVRAKCESGRVDVPRDNRRFYLEQRYAAESFAFARFPEKELTLVSLWRGKDDKLRCCLSDGSDVTLEGKAKRMGVSERTPLGSAFAVRYMERRDEKQAAVGLSATSKGVRYVPLAIGKLDAPPWSKMPSQPGYVTHVNRAKSVYHVVTWLGTEVFSKYAGDKPQLSKGDFVAFRAYFRRVKDEVKLQIVSMQRAEREWVLPRCKCAHHGIAVVDHINQEKKLFHFAFGPEGGGGVIRFDETDLRLVLGQSIEVDYLLYKTPRGERMAVCCVQETDELVSSMRKSITEGNLVVQCGDDGYTPRHGFINHFYYISGRELVEHGIMHDCLVDAELIYGGKNKKGKDRWNVLSLRICE